MSFDDDVGVEEALAGRPDLVATGVDDGLLPSILSARRRTEGAPWRIAFVPGIVDELGRSFVLGTAVAECCARDELVVRTATGPRPDRIGFATADRVDALAGPPGDRTLLTETDPTRVGPSGAAIVRRFERAEPATIGMPGRAELLEAARNRLDARFADDLAAILETSECRPGVLDRSQLIDDRVLLVALAARHDHLFVDVREWAHEVGIVAKQRFGDARRTLEGRGIVELIKVPMDKGRPNNRLRALDETLIRAEPEEFLPALRERIRTTDPSSGSESTETTTRGSDRPVWDRR